MSAPGGAHATDFEARYQADADPWRTLSDPAEHAKASHTLDACGPGPFARACELGAGIGGLTAALAPRCDELIAIDVAPTAVAKAAARLRSFPGARAVTGEIPDDLPRGPFDLVLASEVLYYLSLPDFDRTLAWLLADLERGGRFVVVHWAGEAPDTPQSAHAVRRALFGAPGLRSLRCEDGPTYLLDALERT